MRIRFFALLVPLFASLPVCADNVYLTNGRSFEDVIAETTETQVRIQMAGGVLSLPRSQVLRVEKGESNLAEYLLRKEALQRGAGSKAGDWLDLARWARTRGLEHGAREASLAAAAIDPQHEGLAPILRGFGYVFDKSLDRWIPYADAMRRQGLVLAEGQWITREEHQARVRAAEEASARRLAARQEAARAAREERLAALTELALVRELESSQQVPVYGYPLATFPGYVYIPPFAHPPKPGQPGSPGRPHPRRNEPEPGSPNSFTRVPGSLIPGRLFSSTSSPGN